MAMNQTELNLSITNAISATMDAADTDSGSVDAGGGVEALSDASDASSIFHPFHYNLCCCLCLSLNLLRFDRTSLYYADTSDCFISIFPLFLTPKPMYDTI